MTSLQVQPHARARVQLLGADAADQVARRGRWAANEPRAVDPRQLVKQKLQACWQKLLLAEAPARPQEHLHHEMRARSAQSLRGVEGARCAWLPSRGVLGSLCD